MFLFSIFIFENVAASFAFPADLNKRPVRGRSLSFTHPALTHARTQHGARDASSSTATTAHSPQLSGHPGPRGQSGTRDASTSTSTSTSADVLQDDQWQGLGLSRGAGGAGREGARARGGGGGGGAAALPSICQARPHSALSGDGGVRGRDKRAAPTSGPQIARPQSARTPRRPSSLGPAVRPRHGLANTSIFAQIPPPGGNT